MLIFFFTLPKNLIAGENTCLIHVWADYEFFTKVGGSDEANVSIYNSMYKA